MERADGWAIAWRVGMVSLSGSLGVLGLTGLLLTVSYRPTASHVWDEELRTRYGIRDDRSLMSTIQDMHGWSAGALALSAIVLAVVAVGRRRARGGIFAGGALLLAIAGAYTGLLIAYDQIALEAVTVGESWTGVMKAALSDRVRFLIIDGRRIEPGTFRFWVIVHIALLPLATLGVLARRRRAASFWPNGHRRGTDGPMASTGVEDV